MQLLSLAVIAFVGFRNVQSEPASAAFVLQKYVVECKNDSSREEVDRLCTLPMYKAERKEVKILKDDYGICLCHLTEDQADQLRNSRKVAYVELDEPMSIPDGEFSFLPEDVSTMSNEEETPYGIEMIKSSFLRDKTFQANLTICVVDTGYGVDHPDLPTPIGGFNYDEENLWNVDGDGHGTHIAGTIGAIGSNDIGVIGVIGDPYSFKLFAAKGLKDNGSGTNTQTMAAVAECARIGAKVINMSLGGLDGRDFVSKFYRDIYAQDILIVAAAGNNDEDANFYPASFPFVMSVVAVSSDESLYSSNQVNSQVEIAAPGVGIRSTYTTTVDSTVTFDYNTKSGTSQAAAHVSGGALALWSLFPTCTNNQIRNVLLHSAKQQENSACNEQYGHGILNLEDAYNLLANDGCEAGGNITSLYPLYVGSSGGCEQLVNDYDNPCIDDMMHVNVTIQPGKHSWKDNTRWEIIDLRTNDTVMSGGNFTKAGKWIEVVVSKCLPMTYHKFSIYDDGGDGLGRDGHDPGNYLVKLNNIAIASGTNFGSELTMNFPEYIGSTLAPSPGPSRIPSVSQAPTNICVDCGMFNFFSCRFVLTKTKEHGHEYCGELTEKKMDRQYCKRQLSAKYIACSRNPNPFQLDQNAVTSSW